MARDNGNGVQRRVAVSGTAALCLVMLTANLCAGCRSEQTGDDGPVVVPVNGAEATYDFGYVEPETKHLVRFRVHNDDDVPLEITKVFSDCPCIHILAWPSSIPPAGAGDVLVEFESSERRERYVGQAIVFTNRRERPQLRLHVQAVVGLSLEVRPATLEAGNLSQGQQRELTLHIINHGDQPVRITHGSSDNPLCTLSVPQVAVPPGQAARVLIRLLGDGFPGQRTAAVMIASDSPYQPTLRATVRWTIAEGPGPGDAMPPKDTD